MRYIILLLSLVVFTICNGQTVESNALVIRKNSLYVNAGTTFFTYGLSAYLEHIELPVNSRKKIALKYKIGYGYFEEFVFSSALEELFNEDINSGSPFINVQFGFITGPTKKHHFELDGGVNFFTSGTFDNSFPIAIGYGYRYQKPGGNIIFRFGGAFPEGIYVGLGLAF